MGTPDAAEAAHQTSRVAAHDDVFPRAAALEDCSVRRASDLARVAHRLARS